MSNKGDIGDIAEAMAAAKLRLIALDMRNEANTATSELIEFEKQRLEALLALRAAELARDKWLERNACAMADAGGYH